MVACPAQPQSAEAVREVREILVRVGAELTVNNVYGLELKNGSRVMALPGSDDSIRGLTVDGWIVADEAARLDNDLISALRPMRARRPQARFAMLSTAWSRTDPFWTAWSDDGSIVAAAESHRAMSRGCSRRNISNRNDGRWENTTSTGNISAFPVARRPARSAGTCTNAPPGFACRWWPPGTAFAPPAEHSVPGANPFRRLQINGAFR